MGQRRIDAGDGSKTNRRRRWVKDESTQEMVRFAERKINAGYVSLADFQKKEQDSTVPDFLQKNNLPECQPKTRGYR
jgi:hypothetical protein